MAEDLSETDDLAEAEPERLAAMIALWWEEAERNDVLPLDNRPLWALINKKPDHRRDRTVFRYFQGGAPVPESVGVPVQNRSHAVRVDVAVPEGVVPDGVLLAVGSALGGWSLHFLEGHLVYVHNLYGKTRDVLRSPQALGSGSHQVAFEFTKDRGSRRPGPFARRRRRGGRGGDRPLHRGRLQRGRGGAHLWLRVGPGGGRRV